MIRKRQIHQQQGFTLIEVLAVIVIMGVLASVTLHRIGNVSSSAENTTLTSAIRELNVRESLTWTNLKLFSDTWSGDPMTWSQLDPNLGRGYHWSPGPSARGGTLHFKSQSVQLTRTQSTSSGAAKWY